MFKREVNRSFRIASIGVALVVMAGCTSSPQAEPSKSGVAGGDGSTSTAPNVAVADHAGSEPASAVGSDGTGTATPGSADGSVQSSDPASSDPLPSSTAPATTTALSSTAPSSKAPPIVVPPVAVVSSAPKIGSKNLSPVDPITVSVARGTLTDVALTNAAGYQVKGTLSKDKASWKSAEVLGYGKTYALSGTAVGTDGKKVPLQGSYSVVTPSKQVRATIYPTDDMKVGVAMPIQVKFEVEPADRALIENHVSVTTDPQVKGAWGWIQHDGGTWGLDFRPKGYWPENTKVHVEADVYGLKFADGSYGKTDLTSDFTIGRNQVVKADVGSHNLLVQQDGKTVATYPASYGQGNGNPDLTTRSGIHVVNDMKDEVRMSNPKYGYQNLLERYAVRISNNGEFIHANPNSVASQGKTNVTHGCVNLSLENAKAYFGTAMLGDPVEVTGTDILLGPSDGDIFDYAIPWDQWLTLSALG